MAKQVVNIGDTGQELVDKLGANFTELYGDKHNHPNLVTLNEITFTPSSQTDMEQVQSDTVTNRANIDALQAEATAKWMLLNTVDNRSRSNESRVVGLENNPFVLPAASVAVLGGVKQGSGVSIATDGTLTVSPSVSVIQAPDEATALAQSIANPNNIYFWA